MKKLIIVILLLLFLVGCSSKPKDFYNKLSFNGLDLKTLLKLPTCPDNFFAGGKTDRTNLLRTQAQYLCKEKWLSTYPAVLIPKEQNYLNAIYVNFDIPLSCKEKDYVDFQFSDTSSKKIWELLIEKYGEPESFRPSAYWNFEEEGIEIIYQDIFWPKLTIMFPKADMNKCI